MVQFPETGENPVSILESFYSETPVSICFYSVRPMKQLLALFLVLALLLTCGAASILLARGWFTLRTTTTSAPPALPPAPATQSAPGSAPTPTLAALPNAPAPIGGETGAGFNGAFSGTLTGDNGSSATGTLTLTQSGDTVSGELAIGPGLVIDAGTCGAQSVPQLAQTAAGTIDPAAPNRLRTTSTIPIGGFTIGVALTAELAPDGQALVARADLDLPLLCGRDPSISGTFSRQ